MENLAWYLYSHPLIGQKTSLAVYTAMCRLAIVDSCSAVFRNHASPTDVSCTFDKGYVSDELGI